MYIKKIQCSVINNFKKVDEVLDLFYDKLISFYKKTYNNDNEFYCVQKFLKHIFVFAFMFINIAAILKKISVKEIIIANLSFSIIIGAFSVISFIFIFNDKKKLYKLTDKEWEHYKDKYCYHLTSIENLDGIIVDSENIYLKPTIYWFANLQNWFRKSVYFFSAIPNEKQIKEQLLTNKKDIMIKVKIGDLDRNKLKIRRKIYNVLVYTGPYIGKGEITNFE